MNNNLLIQKRSVGIGLIALLVIANYYNSLTVPFQFDDLGFAIGMNSPMSLEVLLKHWQEYPARFIGLMSFSLDLTFFGKDPFGFHITNIFIHMCNSILVFLFLRKLFGQKFESQNTKLFSLVGALVFAVHPLNTQAVTYLSQRFILLSSMFYLLSLNFYLQYRENIQKEKSNNQSWLYAAALMAIFSNLNKEVAVTIPLVWLFTDFFLNRKFKEFGIKFWVLWIVAFTFPFLLLILAENKAIVDVTNPDTMSPLQYFMTQPGVIANYIQLYLFPVGQTIDHSVYQVKNFLDIRFICFSLFHLFALGFGVYSLFKRRLLGFGIVFYYLVLSPDSSILPLPDLLFEHRTYMANIGIIMGMVGVLMFINESRPPMKKMQLIGLLSGLVLMLSALTIERNKVWQTPESLWGEVIQKNPEGLRAYDILGILFFQKQEYSKAKEFFERLIELSPDDLGGLKNLGVTMIMLKEHKEAITIFRHALSVDSKKAIHYRDLAAALAESGKVDEAVEVLQACIKDAETSGICRHRLQKIQENSQ